MTIPRADGRQCFRITLKSRESLFPVEVLLTAADSFCRAVPVVIPIRTCESRNGPVRVEVVPTTENRGTRVVVVIRLLGGLRAHSTRTIEPGSLLLVEFDEEVVDKTTVIPGSFLVVDVFHKTVVNPGIFVKVLRIEPGT